MKYLSILLSIAMPLFAAVPEGAEEFVETAAKIAPIGYAPDSEAPVVYNPKHGQFSFRTQGQSFTVNIIKSVATNAVYVKETQRHNISYYMLVLDSEASKIYRGSAVSSPYAIDPNEELTEENLMFYKK